MASTSGYIDIITPNTNTIFNNASNNDLVIYTDSINQSVHIGPQTGTQSILKLTKSNVECNGTLICGSNINSLSNIQTSGITRIAPDGGLSNVRINGSSIVAGIVGTSYLPNASTSAAGIVQLSDSTTTSSSSLAATSTAVKTAYDLASNAVPLSGGTMTGNLSVPSLSFPGLNTFKILTGIFQNNGLGSPQVFQFPSPAFSSRPYVCCNPETGGGNILISVHVYNVTASQFTFTSRIVNSSGNYFADTNVHNISYIAVGPA